MDKHFTLNFINNSHILDDRPVTDLGDGDEREWGGVNMVKYVLTLIYFQEIVLHNDPFYNLLQFLSYTQKCLVYSIRELNLNVIK